MQKDVFGARGDFTTSPEISQVFGEVGNITSLSHFQTTSRLLPSFSFSCWVCG